VIEKRKRTAVGEFFFKRFSFLGSVGGNRYINQINILILFIGIPGTDDGNGFFFDFIYEPVFFADSS